MKPNVKQVIVVRKDLKMRRGKEVAQGAHAAMVFFTSRLQDIFDGVRHPANYISEEGNLNLLELFNLSSNQYEWMSNGFKKICLQCNSEEELLGIHEKAKMVGLESHLIRDSGKTEFNGVPTYTALAIGPDDSAKIDEITREYKLY